jgi:hypothetical protein
MQTEALTSTSHDELTRRIKGIMVMEAMAEVFSELTPDQVEAFDASLVRHGKE